MAYSCYSGRSYNSSLILLKAHRMMGFLLLRITGFMKILWVALFMVLCSNVFANDKTSNNPKDGVFWKNRPYINASNLLNGKSTSITLEIESDEAGKVVSVHVIKSSQILALDHYMVRTFENASFYPFQENGEYFPFRVQQTVEFHVDEKESFKTKLINFFK